MRYFYPVCFPGVGHPASPAGIVAAAWLMGRGGCRLPDLRCLPRRLRVGTTGDYRPMSFFDAQQGAYVGFDIALARAFARFAGVPLTFVPTTWPSMCRDLQAGRFDAAFSGITVTEERRRCGCMSRGYLSLGKTVLVTKGREGEFPTLASLDRPSVRILCNPGGTNEQFVRSRLPHAALQLHAVNAEIPRLIAEGKADVMVTDSVEAAYYARRIPALAAPLLHRPFTAESFGVLLPHRSAALRAYINRWLVLATADGTLAGLRRKYGVDG